MRSQLPDGETSLAFLSPDVKVRWGGVLVRQRWVAHPENSFVYVWLFLQSTQDFCNGLESKNAMGQPEILSMNEVILPLRPGRFEET